VELAADSEIDHCRVRHRRRDPIAILSGYAAEL
jgi:hypothetical protein